MYLLDTSTISDAARNPNGSAAKAIISHSDTILVTSVIVACEIEFGLALKKSNKLDRDMRVILEKIQVLPLESVASVHYGNLRAMLKTHGKPIGPNDLLIAAHALALGAILVTNNEREFSRVPELKVENWLRES